jgi:hypothetical protein
MDILLSFLSNYHTNEYIEDGVNLESETFNMAFEKLGRNSLHMVTYANTDTYISYTNGVLKIHNFDEAYITSKLEQAQHDSILLMHVLVCESESSPEGYPSIIAFDKIDKKQHFYAPGSFFGDKLLNRMKYTSFIEGYKASAITPLHELNCLQCMTERNTGSYDFGSFLCLAIAIIIANDEDITLIDAVDSVYDALLYASRYDIMSLKKQLYLCAKDLGSFEFI